MTRGKAAIQIVIEIYSQNYVVHQKQGGHLQIHLQSLLDILPLNEL